jgi:hypothetical protein
MDCRAIGFFFFFFLSYNAEYLRVTFIESIESLMKKIFFFQKSSIGSFWVIP